MELWQFCDGIWSKLELANGIGTPLFRGAFHLSELAGQKIRTLIHSLKPKKLVLPFSYACHDLDLTQNSLINFTRHLTSIYL